MRASYEYRDISVLSEEAGNDLIFKTILKNEPAMIARMGSIETHCAYPWMIGKEPQQKDLDNGRDCAGIFPPTTEANASFSKIYLDSMRSIDVLGICGVYKENKILRTYCPSASFLPARSIEPYYYDSPWSRALEGKSVLVIHPFVNSIRTQYAIREKIFQNSNTLPEFKEISFVPAVQSNAGAKCGFPDWTAAYHYMCEEISKKEFDVAIIGAGAYALPLAAHVKQMGKIAVQMSGATQLLFGIKGKRWDNHPIISSLYNKHWIRPSSDETPPQSEKVEGGSYW